ncbi:hypothetical protein DSO57_1013270 [Entomophthora muscae]|uniref:Uncharacterized protein n=2 Tax=Entomophthora muscae TaxID=34485 RepID=A0ACC2U407_9FUNG|nr:hypothetical protein DSO57_1032339 [Entomophthora muscae]KAJ9081560.1 hypothetical protein DSO57_1013270 [Entomophthora muscae]
MRLFKLGLAGAAYACLKLDVNRTLSGGTITSFQVWFTENGTAQGTCSSSYTCCSDQNYCLTYQRSAFFFYVFDFTSPSQPEPKTYYFWQNFRELTGPLRKNFRDAKLIGC